MNYGAHTKNSFVNYQEKKLTTVSGDHDKIVQSNIVILQSCCYYFRSTQSASADVASRVKQSHI